MMVSELVYNGIKRQVYPPDPIFILKDKAIHSF
jgi:hypothetical protein